MKIKSVIERIGNEYKIKYKRLLEKKDVISYFHNIINEEQPYCERCGTLYPNRRLNRFWLCKYCYYTKVNMPDEESTPDIEDIARFGLDKKKLFTVC